MPAFLPKMLKHVLKLIIVQKLDVECIWKVWEEFGPEMNNVHQIFHHSCVYYDGPKSLEVFKVCVKTSGHLIGIQNH